MTARRVALVAAVVAAIIVLAAGVSQEERATHVANFKAWASENGLSKKITGITPMVRDGEASQTAEYGMVAEVDLADRDTVVRVPLKNMMTWHSASDSDIGDALREHYRLFSTHLILVLHLVYEKHNPASPWKEYIDMMPSADDVHVPILWSKKDLAWLQASPLKDDTERDLANLKEDYTQKMKKMFRWYPELFTKDVFSKSEFLWGNAMVWSRGLTAEIEPEKMSRVLVPVVDMFAVSPTARMRGGYDRKTQEFVVSMGEDVAAGDEVFLNDRQSGNTELLAQYGFVRPDNEFDTVVIPLSLKHKDTFYDERLDLLEQNKFRAKDKTTLYVGDDINPDLLAFTRICKMKVSEIESAEDFYQPLSLETEVKVHGIIAAKLKKLQDAYETTIAEDEALLEGDSLTHRQRLAVVVRLGEKKVLRHNFNLARTKLRQLKEAEESAAGLPKAEL